MLRPERGCGVVVEQPENLPGAQSQIYKTTGRRALRMHVFRPAEPLPARPAVLFFFGGGWRTGDIAQFEEKARLLAGLGYVAALADYRVSCRDDSDVTQSLVDGRDAYAWLRARGAEFGFDPANMFLSGGSAGGHIALAAAMLASDKPAGLVLFNPAVDLRITAKPEEMPTAVRISPSDLPVAGMPPVLILQGDADMTTPIGQSRAFCARMNAKGLSCELVEYAGRDHGFFNDRAIDPRIHRSPHDDTTERMLNFLAIHSSSRR